MNSVKRILADRRHGLVAGQIVFQSTDWRHDEREIGHFSTFDSRLGIGPIGTNVQGARVVGNGCEIEYNMVDDQTFFGTRKMMDSRGHLAFFDVSFGV